MPKYDVLTAMDVCVDIIIRGNVMPELGQVEHIIDDYSVMMGGSAPIFACQCAKLGLATAGLGTVGADAFGEVFLKTLRGSGVDTAYTAVDPAAKTGVTFILCKGADRGMLTYMGAIDATRPEAFTDELLRSARHLHIASYFLMPSLRGAYPGIIRRAKALGLTVSLDTNWDPDNAWHGVRELVSLCDIYMPNENELLAVTGARDIEEGLRVARGWAPHIALKIGEHGARYAGVLGEAAAPAHKTDYIDAVGAGDSFDGGFLWGFLGGRSAAECLKAGCAAGSMNTRGAGGTATQIRLDEMPAWMG